MPLEYYYDKYDKIKILKYLINLSIGTLAVVIGFAMCYCSKPEYLQMSMTAYYLTFVILFQIGWAVVQISHLSVLPIISTDKACSNELTAIRYYYIYKKYTSIHIYIYILRNLMLYSVPSLNIYNWLWTCYLNKMYCIIILINNLSRKFIYYLWVYQRKKQERDTILLYFFKIYFIFFFF